VLLITSNAADADAPRLQGLGRALVANVVKGVSEGFTQILELHGTGYRCEVKANAVHLTVGLSHPAAYALPENVKATVPGDSKGTVLILESPDKAVLGEVAAGIRRIRPPEPYGGKGIRYRGEQIRRKAGKAGKGRK
jgi:large subunit ribosomal protein L6